MLIKKPFIAALGLTGLVLSLHWSGTIAATHESVRSRCQLSGVYIGHVPDHATFTIINIPLDPRGMEVMMMINTIGYEPTFDGVFPTAVGQSLLRGFLQKKAHDTYAGQLVRYRYDATGAVVATEIGALNVSLADCNTVAINFKARLFYFGFVNPGDTHLPEPDMVYDVSGIPPTIARKMLQYDVNQPSS